MRSAFVDELTGIAAEDERIVLMTGDLGFTVLEKFANCFPDRYINVGVAEANMVGLATGLAKRGFLPFCYSIATFASMRPYEQIRSGPVRHHLPVRIVGIGGGFAYGHAGSTHHALEDFAILRSLPEMTVVCPADDAQARAALRATYSLPGPVYYRIGKDRASIPELHGRFSPIQLIGDGQDAIIVATAGLSAGAVEAARRLRQVGLEATVAVIAMLQPAPEDELAKVLSAHRFAIAVEDHSINGGLGSLCAELIAERGITCRLQRLGVRVGTGGRSGSESWLRHHAGIGVDDIVRAARDSVDGKPC